MGKDEASDGYDLFAKAGFRKHALNYNETQASETKCTEACWSIIPEAQRSGMSTFKLYKKRNDVGFET